MLRWLLPVALVAFALDQGSKWYVFRQLRLEDLGKIDVLPPFLVFYPGINTGVNFGLFADGHDAMRWVLIALALGICVALAIWARSFERPAEFVSAGLIMGGALGNVVDRLYLPGVLDFLNMSCCGLNNPYLFNVADIFIFAGAIGLILFQGRKNEA
ncbi:signal peptidase II [Alphaproteobacteria bacterium KMM 3653]|uniref:Lipoprotein signal peptidase n=1 Tax=Harenicola maris TaxID=2841044 RepID=A0AAP2G460_9RHOB|nr:signal peptidase II [Harenicola maris]